MKAFSLKRELFAEIMHFLPKKNLKNSSASDTDQEINYWTVSYL